MISRRVRFSLFSALAAGASLGLAVQCSSPDGPIESASRASVADAETVRAWDTIYGVLQHPRCLNCHPVDDVPFQGDHKAKHAQNVHGGPDGKGLFAMQCATCHGTANVPGAHMPPGAPNWHLPKRDMPLVFEGMSRDELCRQMRDPAQNGGKTPEQLFEHMAHDPLVLWGWAPGDGRTRVSTPHAELVAAVRTWVDSGCDCPE